MYFIFASKTFFWERAHRLHPTTKGVHDTKRVRSCWRWRADGFSFKTRQIDWLREASDSGEIEAGTGGEFLRKEIFLHWGVCLCLKQVVHMLPYLHSSYTWRMLKIEEMCASLARLSPQVGWALGKSQARHCTWVQAVLPMHVGLSMALWSAGLPEGWEWLVDGGTERLRGSEAAGV